MLSRTYSYPIPPASCPTSMLSFPRKYNLTKCRVAEFEECNRPDDLLSSGRDKRIKRFWNFSLWTVVVLSCSDSNHIWSTTEKEIALAHSFFGFFTACLTIFGTGVTWAWGRHILVDLKLRLWQFIFALQKPAYFCSFDRSGSLNLIQYGCNTCFILPSLISSLLFQARGRSRRTRGVCPQTGAEDGRRGGQAAQPAAHAALPREGSVYSN